MAWFLLVIFNAIFKEKRSVKTYLHVGPISH
jgi:hypothetical protein